MIDTCRLKFMTVLMALCGMVAWQIQAEEQKFGDVNDGNRSITVHLIDLYDETGSVIRPGDQPMMPFSTRQSCIECHSYDKISAGWHFNANYPDVPPGRKGHPWILVDYISGTQLPLSHRQWDGTYRPEVVGLTPWYFIQEFGRHSTGGGIGENDSSDVDDVYLRWLISGKLEINCLSCHEAEASHDQAEYAKQTRNQNFRWAAAATSGFATVRGSARAMPNNYDIYYGIAPDDSRSIPPSVFYHESRFNPQGKIFVDLTREIPVERCYFCHSTKINSGKNSEKWQTDEDVHLAAGLKCVDCHRNGLDHAMIRGYEGEAKIMNNPIAQFSTCDGCHIGEKSVSRPEHGRLGAPQPKHTGIPTIHFDKLNCTVCHAGPRPTGKAQIVKTSMAHGLGVHGIVKSDSVLPYILSPIYVKGERGKIEPHKMLFPSFWGFMNGDSVKPVHPSIVRPLVLAIIAKDTLTDSTNYNLISSGKWPDFTQELLISALDTLSSLDSTAGTPVYITKGKLYRLTEKGQILKRNHPAAQPYSWALAHDVRPAAQALGSHSCGDCHSVNAAFSFGKVEIQSPLTFEPAEIKTMNTFHHSGGIYERFFAFTFFFRPLLKLMILFSCIFLTAVLILYLFKGLDYILTASIEKESH